MSIPIECHERDQLFGTRAPPGLGSIQTMRWAAKNPPNDPQVSFSGMNVMLTGANSGIGYEAAVKFAKLGASKVILAVRTLEKGYAAKHDIQMSVGEGYKCGRLIVMQLDMDDFGSVKRFATSLEEEVGADGLQVAILNAGIAPGTYSVAKETGWESSLQVNVLSTAFLAICLLPLLKLGSEGKVHPAQLIFTGSAECVSVTEDIPVDVPHVLEALNEPESFHPRKSYLITKLLVVYVMQGLIDDYLVAPLDQQCPVVISVVCPGYTVTNLARDLSWPQRTVMMLMNMYCGRSAEEGSRSLLSASLLGAAGHGKFWTNDNFLDLEYTSTAEGQKLQARVWKEIRDVCLKEL
uniref:TqaC n=1 Tax=Penicillium aethiopicum TaxID=36650 RepID=F1CWD4_PENAE|nr:TqaC [Penicillium aethiopicum]